MFYDLSTAISTGYYRWKISNTETYVMLVMERWSSHFIMYTTRKVYRVRLAYSKI